MPSDIPHNQRPFEAAAASGVNVPESDSLKKINFLLCPTQKVAVRPIREDSTDRLPVTRNQSQAKCGSRRKLRENTDNLVILPAPESIDDSQNTSQTQ
jgi:hypothetical protein